MLNPFRQSVVFRLTLCLLLTVWLGFNLATAVGHRHHAVTPGTHFTVDNDCAVCKWTDALAMVAFLPLPVLFLSQSLTPDYLPLPSFDRPAPAPVAASRAPPTRFLSFGK